MNSKKTKGKQKIPMKKIENEDHRMVLFSKHHNDIYTKLSELSVRYGADFAFLINSGSGRPYIFGSPSFETVAKRFLNGERSSSTYSSLRLIAESCQKGKIEELCKIYNNLLVEANEEEEKVVVTGQGLEVKEDAWWKVNPTKVKEDEDVKQLLKKHEELYEKLCVEATKRNSGKDGGISK